MFPYFQHIHNISIKSSMLSKKKEEKINNKIIKAKQDIKAIITKFKSIKRLKKHYYKYKNLIKKKK